MRGGKTRRAPTRPAPRNRLSAPASLFVQILHEPLKLRIAENEVGRVTDQSVDLVIRQIERCRNLNERETFVRIEDFTEAGINEIDFGIRGKRTLRIPGPVT